MEKSKIKIINQTQSGKIFKCRFCDKIHIEFKNLYFTFTKEEYNNFKNYFLDFDENYWESIRKNSTCKRKIMVPVGHKNISLLFNSEEIKEFKHLFSPDTFKKKNPDIISFANLEIKFSMN